MKLKLALIVILLVGLAALLSACGGSKAVKTSQTVPTGPNAAVESKANPAGTDQSALKGPTTPMATTGRESRQPVVMLKDVYFDFDRYSIRPEDVQILKGDYAWFAANPGKRVMIEGNCDERGSIEYNLVLGQKRADAAKDFLIRLGVQSNSLKTISYGKEKPVDPGHDEQAWAKNRRDHIEPER